MKFLQISALVPFLPQDLAGHFKMPVEEMEQVVLEVEDDYRERGESLKNRTSGDIEVLKRYVKKHFAYLKAV